MPDIISETPPAAGSNGKTLAAPGPAPDCPLWCARAHQGDPDEIHVSDEHAVPAADGHHECFGHEDESAAEPCELGICAGLIASPGESPEVELHHGYDFLPAITLGDADALARLLLSLVRTGRAQAPVTSK